MPRKPRARKIPNTTIAIEPPVPPPPAPRPHPSNPWTTKVRYEQVYKGQVVLVRESVDACLTPGGKWVVRHRDIGVTMSPGDRIVTPDGQTLRIVKFTGESQRLLVTEPLVMETRGG